MSNQSVNAFYTLFMLEIKGLNHACNFSCFLCQFGWRVRVRVKVRTDSVYPIYREQGRKNRFGVGWVVPWFNQARLGRICGENTRTCNRILLVVHNCPWRYWCGFNQGIFVYMEVVMTRQNFQKMSPPDSKIGHQEILDGYDKFWTYVFIVSLGTTTILLHTLSYDIGSQ